MPSLIWRGYQEKFNSEIWSCCWSLDQSGQDLMLYSGLDEDIKMVQLNEGQIDVIDSINIPQSQAIAHIRPHQKMPWIVSTALIGRIDIIDIHTKKTKYSALSSTCINWPAFFSTPQTICAPSKDSLVALKDIEKNEDIITFNTKSPYITCACINDPYGTLACCNADGVVEVFDINSGKLIYVMEGHALPIKSIDYSMDGMYLVTGSQDSLVKLYDARNSSFVGSFSAHTSWVTSVKFKCDNSYFISCSLDATLKFWSPSTLSCIDTKDVFEKGGWCIAFNNSGSKFMGVGEGCDLVIFTS